MDVTLSSAPWRQLETAALVVFSPEKTPDKSVDEAAGGWLKDLYDSGEFSGKAMETAVLHRPAGLKAKRLLAVGTGKAEEFTAAVFRNAAATAVRALKAAKVQQIALFPGQDRETPALVEAAVEGAILATWEPDAYKTESKKDEKPVGSIVIATSGGANLQGALERGRILAESQNYARDVANEPGNRLTPLVFAERARETAEAYGLEYEMLDEQRMSELGMGSLLGVAMGSAAPPALILLRYKPRQAKGSDHLGLVGKGVTFDTGGISIKPADGMEKMKFDMCGGAAVLGAMRVIAQLKPAIAVTGVIPAVENMPGSKAQRPGDIVKSLNGKTVEVLNTDAEGRLILIDAITYALRMGCTHLVDAATLTGAIVVALGHERSGAFSNNQEFLNKVLAAAERQGEKMWAMPLDAEYKELLKSPFADLANIGGRAGGSITAAMFLKEFTEDKPWVHLDIAGTAWLDEKKPWAPKGPTGIPLRTFVDLAMNWE